ncbi:MAG: tetratricopeptide repeat protein [Phycisphaerales bacterium]
MPTREQIQKLLSLEPNDPFMLYALATDYAKEGEHERAVEQFALTIKEDPDYVYAYFHQARSLEALQRIDEARATLDTGLEAAKRTNDAKGISEISSYRTML